MKNQIGSHKTSVTMDKDNVLLVAYHNTIVVKVTDDELILNSDYNFHMIQSNLNFYDINYNSKNSFIPTFPCLIIPFSVRSLTLSTDISRSDISTPHHNLTNGVLESR